MDAYPSSSTLYIMYSTISKHNASLQHRMEHLGRNKNPIRKLGQNVREKTRKFIFYYISGYGRLGISITKSGKAGDG